MNTKAFIFLAAVTPFAWHLIPLALGESATSSAANTFPELPLFNQATANVESRFAPQSGSEGQVEATRSQDPAAPGVVVTVKPGKAGFPGIWLSPEGPKGAVWDLSQYGHIDVRIANTGTKALSLTARVDNVGDWKTSPWDAESVTVKPGKSGTANVIFGYAYGHKPNFKLNPAAVAQVLLFMPKSNEERSFRIESIQAGGPPGEQPPVNLSAIRVKPKDGLLLGGTEAIDAGKQIEAKAGKASLEGHALKIEFTSNKGQSVVFKPAVGRWDLREAVEIRVKVKNIGHSPVSPRVQVVSNGSGATDEATTSAPLAPGAQGEVVATFMPKLPWLGIKDSAKTSWNGQPGTGTTFMSDAVGAVKFMPNPSDASESLLVESIEAGVPEPTKLPDWVGKKPPVEGDWVKTFDEEFDGNKLDESKWNIYAANYWDKRSHFSKDNVILGGGVVKLRMEKKTGFHADDPSKKQTDYATGFLDTYGKWVQRYGYFESRMKATKGPGMWPAFWLMPDRGVQAGPQWKRANTGDNGMEFDIWEFLGRWGQYRYNIAMHWDGYGKGHQQTGVTTNYVMPDKDGFITMGLLWTPGVAVYYANGKEVLRWETPRISNIPSDIMFTNVTGGWDNDGIDDMKMPDDYTIDYVRAWQRKDLASSVDGPQAPAPSATPATK